jgi:hypothetical protein
MLFTFEKQSCSNQLDNQGYKNQAANKKHWNKAT